MEDDFIVTSSAVLNNTKIIASYIAKINDGAAKDTHRYGCRNAQIRKRQKK
jgi:hypothetical protein